MCAPGKHWPSSAWPLLRRDRIPRCQTPVERRGDQRAGLGEGEPQYGLHHGGRGNSPQRIFKHYRVLVTEEEAETWFGIAPKSKAEGKIVELEKKAALRAEA